MKRERYHRRSCLSECFVLLVVGLLLVGLAAAGLSRLISDMNRAAQPTGFPPNCTPAANFGTPKFMSGYVRDVTTRRPIPNADVMFSASGDTANCGPLQGELHFTTDGNGFFTTYPTYTIAPIVSGNNVQNRIIVTANGCEPLSLPFDSVHDFSAGDPSSGYRPTTEFLGNTIEIQCGTATPP